MSFPEISHIERNHTYKQKLSISKRMLKLTGDFYTALRNIAKLEDQKIEQLSVIKNFCDLFYEQDCVYKEYTGKWSRAIEAEIEAGRERAGFLKSVDNFAGELKKAFQRLTVMLLGG